MFFKNRSGASRLMKTVIFEVVPRGPGDPRVSPEKKLNLMGRMFPDVENMIFEFL